jgi:hypothetical protein
MLWSKLLTLKNLNDEVNGKNGDPGKCNSNAAYLSFSDRQRRYGRMRMRHWRENFADEFSIRI